MGSNVSATLLYTGVSALLLAGCGGGKGGGGGMTDGGTGDAGSAADAGPPGDSGTPVACTPVDNFGNLGTINGMVFSNAQNGYLGIDGVIELLKPENLLAIDLFGGYGVFADGLKTGTFTITGAEQDFNTCGVCVSVLADLDPMVGPKMLYMAQTGTVTITSIEGNFTGSFAPNGDNTTFVGATFNEASEMYETRSDCTVTGGGAIWDKAIPSAP